MPAPRNLLHVILSDQATSERFVSPRSSRKQRAPAPASRAEHGNDLRNALESLQVEDKARKNTANRQIPRLTRGTLVEFESFPGVPLEPSALESRRAGIQLRSLTTHPVDDSGETQVQRAIVFVPRGKLGHFVRRIEKYASDTPKAPKERRYEDTFDRLQDIRLASVRSLWTDPVDALPLDETLQWLEVWLQRSDGRELDRFREFAPNAGIQVVEQSLVFDDRIVTLARCSLQQLADTVDVFGDIAELRHAKEQPSFFADMGHLDQQAWVEELASRLHPPGEADSTICILGTGINYLHPLLSVAIKKEDCHSVSNIWGAMDNWGHGTEMAGVSLFGDLSLLLASSEHVRLRVRLESVKMIEPGSATDPNLYGLLTSIAMGIAELQAPERMRSFLLAVTSKDERDVGRPTSWSAAVDALASGRVIDQDEQGLVYLDSANDRHSRVILVSAGNVDVDKMAQPYLDVVDLEPIHDPGQSWNAVTVGAYTDKAVVSHPDWTGWCPAALPGDLSPHSTTSVPFEAPWPNKPEIVLEGGNVLFSEDGIVEANCPDVMVLTTGVRPNMRLLTTTCATSASSAEAARMASLIRAEYPRLWPESVRALLIHSARWTDSMRAHLPLKPSRAQMSAFVRRYGYGVPDITRALRSGTDALTIISEGAIAPQNFNGAQAMNWHDLPWPADELFELGNAGVRLRVTLSYFVDPNPARRGWAGRYQYASHGLRFEIKTSTEDDSQFRQRINKLAVGDQPRPQKTSDAHGWVLGENIRNRGSIHHDIYECSAAELAERSAVAVFPVSGWARQDGKWLRADMRYSLVVSIEAEEQDVNLWDSVAGMVDAAKLEHRDGTGV